MNLKHILLFTALTSTSVMAEEDIFQFDVGGLNVTPHALDNDKRVYPKKSDFKVIYAHPMTSNTGKRAALVTIENTASGHRSIESTQVMALFADGYRTDAKQVSYKDNLKANESRTFTLNFGEYEYPIIAVYATQNLD